MTDETAPGAAAGSRPRTFLFLLAGARQDGNPEALARVAASALAPGDVAKDAAALARAKVLFEAA